MTLDPGEEERGTNAEDDSRALRCWAKFDAAQHIGSKVFAYFTALISGLPIGVVVLPSALVFGLAHTYQGPAGIVKTCTLGILFGVLYWMTGWLLAPMLLHAAVDLTSGWMSWQFIRKGDATRAAKTPSA